MRVVNLRASAVDGPRITALCYGATRSGKTKFAGSWPRPLFLSDVTESGWVTLQTMDRSGFYEPDRDPIVWGIETISDMAEASAKMDPLIAKGEVRTIVIDSLTFYADLYFNHLLALMGSRPDNRRAYGDLNNHLRDLRVRMHQKQVNVLWLALDKQPDSENPIGGPMIPGQQASKFAAGCDFILYHRQVQEGKESTRWEVRTKKFGPYVAGGRDGGVLPDPMEPDYRMLIGALQTGGIAPDDVDFTDASAAPTPITSQASAAAQAVPQIVISRPAAPVVRRTK